MEDRSTITLDEILIMLLNNELNTKDDWNNLCRNYTLSEDIIEKYKDKFDWRLISIYQTLSESFIERYKNKFNWD